MAPSPPQSDDSLPLNPTIHRPGRYVCSYVGEVLSLSQLLERYATEPPVYVFRLSSTTSIDARNSSHFSRFINHDAHPNLQISVSKASKRIDIFAKRPLHVGSELTIDYVCSMNSNHQPRLGDHLVWLCRIAAVSCA